MVSRSDKDGCAGLLSRFFFWGLVGGAGFASGMLCDFIGLLPFDPQNNTPIFPVKQFYQPWPDMAIRFLEEMG